MHEDAAALATLALAVVLDHQRVLVEGRHVLGAAPVGVDLVGVEPVAIVARLGIVDAAKLARERVVLERHASGWLGWPTVEQAQLERTRGRAAVAFALARPALTRGRTLAMAAATPAHSAMTQHDRKDLAERLPGAADLAANEATRSPTKARPRLALDQHQLGRPGRDRAEVLVARRQAKAIRHWHEGQQIHRLGRVALGPAVHDAGALAVDAGIGIEEPADVIGARAAGHGLHEHDLADLEGRLVGGLGRPRGPVRAKPRQDRADPSMIDVGVGLVDHRIAARMGARVLVQLDLEIDADVAQRSNDHVDASATIARDVAARIVDREVAVVVGRRVELDLADADPQIEGIGDPIGVTIPRRRAVIRGQAVNSFGRAQERRELVMIARSQPERVLAHVQDASVGGGGQGIDLDRCLVGVEHEQRVGRIDQRPQPLRIEVGRQADLNRPVEVAEDPAVDHAERAFGGRGFGRLELGLRGLLGLCETGRPRRRLERDAMLLGLSVGPRTSPTARRQPEHRQRRQRARSHQPGCPSTRS